MSGRNPVYLKPKMVGGAKTGVLLGSFFPDFADSQKLKSQGIRTNVRAMVDKLGTQAGLGKCC